MLGVTAQLTSQRDVRCEEWTTTFTHRNYYLCNNIVSLAVKHLLYNSTYDHEYDLTKQQKPVTDVSCFISDMSPYLCVFHSRANFMQGIHKYFLPVVVQYILISISDRPTAFTSQDDGANLFKSVNEFTLFGTCLLQVKLQIFAPKCGMKYFIQHSPLL